MQKTKSNSKLTVLLALKDRDEFTCRWMDYAEYSKMPFDILVADGSIGSKTSDYFSNKKNTTLRYKYIRYPADDTYFIYYSKILNALSKVKTKYVVRADNDDFFISDGLEKSVDFLESHDDYASCRGVVGSVNIFQNSDKYTDGLYGNKVKFDLYKSISNVNASALQRVKEHFSFWNKKNHYFATYYDVHRTSDLIKFYQTLVDLNTKDLYLAELLLGYMAIATGKAKRGRYNYLIRHQNSPGSSATTHRKKWGDSYDRMFLDTWSSDFSKFTNAVAVLIAGNDKVSIGRANDAVEEGYKAYISPHVVDCIIKPNILIKIFKKIGGIFSKAALRFEFRRLIKELDPIKTFVLNNYKANK
jgi:glycosyltransferase domain-containing protein